MIKVQFCVERADPSGCPCEATGWTIKKGSLAGPSAELQKSVVHRPSNGSAGSGCHVIVYKCACCVVTRVDGARDCQARGGGQCRAAGGSSGHSDGPGGR